MTRSASVWVRGSGVLGTSLMWKHDMRAPSIWSRSSTEPPPRIMWKTSATTSERGSPEPSATARAPATVLIPSTKPRNSIAGVTPACWPSARRSRNRDAARLAEVGDRPARGEVLGDLVVPRLDRPVAERAGDPDLLQERRRPDRARVEAVGELAHRVASASLGARPSGLWVGVGLVIA